VQKGEMTPRRSWIIKYHVVGTTFTGLVAPLRGHPVDGAVARV